MAVPLQPGDYFMYNARVPHCISSSCKMNDEIMCASVYLKTAVVEAVISLACRWIHKYAKEHLFLDGVFCARACYSMFLLAHRPRMHRCADTALCPPHNYLRLPSLLMALSWRQGKCRCSRGAILVSLIEKILWQLSAGNCPCCIKWDKKRLANCSSAFCGYYLFTE